MTKQIALHKMAELATETAQIVLQSGGETHRVENIIHKVCKQFGYEKVESFVTPTGIFLSVWDDQDHVATSVKRISSRTTDLDKIARISKLCNDIKLRSLTPEQYEQEMHVLELRRVYPLPIQVLFGGISASFYSLLFGGSWLDFGVAFFTGIFIILFNRSLYRMHFNIFLINAFCGALAVFIARFSGTYISGLQTDKIVIGSIMLLVPGLAITNAIRDTMAGDLVSGTARMVEAFFIAIAIAAGTGSMLKLWYLWY
jgi:uncharacterized membrane protein YjjP (DUF1212 family)